MSGWVCSGFKVDFANINSRHADNIVLKTDRMDFNTIY